MRFSTYSEFLYISKKRNEAVNSHFANYELTKNEYALIF